MQTSSNFFNKNLFTVDQYSPSHRRTDKYHESHIVPDPLRLKDELTPWTEINPKYNFNTERLIRFKQKVHQQQLMQPGPNNPQISEVKQVKSEMISNLFNFYKNNKEKKRSTLNNAKRKSHNNTYDTIDQTDNGWTLPPIDDKSTLEEDLVQNKQSLKRLEQIQAKEKKDKKQSGTYIESISIRQYLMKLKEKERVFSSSQATEKLTAKDHHILKSQIQQFTSSRHSKPKNKNPLSNSISSVKDLGNEDISYRYAPIRNPENYSYKKRSYLSPLQSLQQSFQIYKKAAEQQVQESIGSRKHSERYSNKINAHSIGEKQYWKNNVPLSSLLSSPVLEGVKRNDSLNQSISPIKKYNTISYSKSFSPTVQSVQLPKINKQSPNR